MKEKLGNAGKMVPLDVYERVSINIFMQGCLVCCTELLSTLLPAHPLSVNIT